MSVGTACRRGIEQFHLLGPGGDQRFQIGRRIIGLQFHPEMTSAEIQYFIRDFSWELKAESGIQSADVIERGITAYAGAANKLLADILVYLSE